MAVSNEPRREKTEFLPITGTFLKRDCTTKSLFLFKKCCFWGVKIDFKV